jgi:lysophospholipase L1-like esterase
LQEAAERISPGKLSSFLVGVRAAATQRNLPLIDCSAPGSCGVSEDGFADPVHLNASGAAAFSAALAQHLSALVAAH